MVDALLTALHRRTGRTTSPHLQSAVERIAIDGEPISPAHYVETYREIEPFVETGRQAVAGGIGGPAMSKFEVVTAMAFAAFADAPVDVAVVEVGMGGRWDATNVVDAPVAVITPIGSTTPTTSATTSRHRRREGGHHQAGARCPGRRPTPSRSSGGRCRRRWRCCWRRRSAPTPRWPGRIRSSRCWAARSPSAARCCELQGLGGVYPEIFLPLHGEHQAHNAAVALAAVEAFFGAGARAPARHRCSPGRVRRRHQPRPAGTSAQRAHGIHRRRAQPGGRRGAGARAGGRIRLPLLVGVVSVMADKDADGILAALEPVFDQIVVTHNGSPRALDVERWRLPAEERFGPERVITAPTLPDAIETATALVEERGHRTTASPAPGSSSPDRWSPPVRRAPCSEGTRQ